MICTRIVERVCTLLVMNVWKGCVNGIGYLRVVEVNRKVIVRVKGSRFLVKRGWLRGVFKDLKRERVEAFKVDIVVVSRSLMVRMVGYLYKDN